MQDAPDAVLRQQQAPAPLHLLLPGVATPAPAARRVSAEAFLQATTMAWGHLQPAERKAIRASCRAGRLQHDRMLRELSITMGSYAATQVNTAANKCTPPPPPPQMRASLQAALARGARPQSLTACFRRADDQREAQLLAALEACSGCPVSRLEMSGALPLSGAVAEAVEACCPQLDCIHLTHPFILDPTEIQAGGETSLRYHLGCVQLLTLCGPRLRELHLRNVHWWHPLSYMAVARCTALVSLELDAGVRPPPSIGGYWSTIGGRDVEAHVFGGIAQLRSLRSLRLIAHIDPATCAPDILRPHATCVARLSALTGLTRLQLDLSRCYMHHGDSWERQHQDGEQHAAWLEVREAHRTSLLSALRAMPQLQHLDCPTLWLQPSDLPACLTALTSLTLGGLLPLLAGEGPGGLGDRGGPLADSGALPPQLRELVLTDAVSPRALASLLAPPSLTCLAVSTLRFGISDVMPDGRLRPEAVAAVGPAVRRVVAHRDATCGADEMYVLGDGNADKVLPCGGSANGHSEWIRQLRGLDVFGVLVLRGLAGFRTGDMCCLAEALPGLQELHIQECVFPLSSVPGLRPHMTQLAVLDLDLAHCEDACDPVLTSVALLLLRPHPGAVQLRALVCRECPDAIDMEACDQVVRERLERDFGVTDVPLVLTDWG